MVAAEDINCGGIGFLRFSDIAIVSGRVFCSRGNLAERYREVQLRSNKLRPDSVLLLELLGLCASLFHVSPTAHKCPLRADFDLLSKYGAGRGEPLGFQ